MYLCIGVLLTLITKFRKGSSYNAPKNRNDKKISNEDICEKLFACCLDKDDMYSAQKISPIINCKPDSHLKRRIVDYYKDYCRDDETDVGILHSDFMTISNDILDDVIKSDYIKAFIESILIVIENDNDITAETIVGMDREYTKNNILNNWNKIDARAFLANVLYFCYLRPDNEKGANTLEVFKDSKFINSRLNSLNYISFKKDNNGKQILTYNKSKANTSTELPQELTDTIVIRGSAEKILFREKEFSYIIDTIQSKDVSNVFLHGMGGCGKTSLARMVYCHLKDQYDCCGWINYSGNIKQNMISCISIDYNDDTVIENDVSKKWETLKKVLKNNTQSKLLVIDNVDNIDSIEQYPMQDKELIKMASWHNMTIIITSRLSGLPGYDTSFEIENLGDANNSKNCIELFYHYNPRASRYRAVNEETVSNLCFLAGYNTMIIELLAKGSLYYSHKLDKYYQKLLTNNFSCADDTFVETDHDFTILRTDNTNNNYYDIGNETVASQLFKLFNLKTRKPMQQLILWDFHCLRENERVSIDELYNWMGFSLKDIAPLVREGWITQQDDYFFIHPLVNQAISCSHETSKTYWDIKKIMINDGKCSDEFISAITKNTFFHDSDSIELSLRKLLFVDCLTYNGDYLSSNIWINIADYARRRGDVNLGIYYYKKAHNHYSSLVSTNANIDIKQYWKCTYFYSYMLSYTKSGYTEAENLLKKSLEIAEHIIQEKGDTDDNILILATSLDYLGYILSNSLNNDIIRITLADTYLKEAVMLRQILCSAHPEHYRLMHDYAWSLDNLGAFYTKIDVRNINFDTKQESNGIIHLTEEEIVQNKRHTEALLKEALEIRLALSKARGDECSTEVAWTYFNLAELIYNNLVDDSNSNDINRFLNIALRQNKLQNAETYINKALDIYHRLDQRYPGQHMSSEARTTALYGKLLILGTERYAEALTHLDKAMQLYKTLDNETSGIYKEELRVLHMIYHNLRT